MVLVVDDAHRALRALPRLISREAFEPVWVPDEATGLEVLRRRAAEVRVVVVDLKTSAMGGGGFLHRARELAPGAAVLVTGPLGPFLYRDGAFFAYTGPSLGSEINAVLQGIAGVGRPSPALSGQPGPSRRPDRFGPLLGASPAMGRVYARIDSLRTSLATVLIQGESGTGKELVARTIHDTSPRAQGPFVAINCGAIPGPLMESELFGHEKGAFTGASSRRQGKFEVARGGTLFLDEIGELDRDLQVKLLRVLQEREFYRVGGNRAVPADVRVIAATSRDLRSAVRDGEFREDLFYRLHVVPVELPPLRERKGDIPLLLDHFFRTTAAAARRSPPRLTPEARQALLHYPYPGNVRELANLVERLVVLCGEQAGWEDLPEEVRRSGQTPSDGRGLLKELPEEGVSLREVEKELITKTLRQTGGNKQAAARRLGITRRLLYLRLAEYGIDADVTSGDTSKRLCHLA
ncbi:MAG: sigma-54 dependent transcriptional regulator [Deferrisomatales bacterium]